VFTAVRIASFWAFKTARTPGETTPDESPEALPEASPDESPEAAPETPGVEQTKEKQIAVTFKS